MPYLVKNKNKMGSPEERARELVAERTTYAASRNAGHFRLLRKFWRYYLTSTDLRGAYRHENDRDPGSGAEWRADLFVPASFSVIETAVPRIVFALFGSRPFVKVIGRERSDMERAPAVEAMLDYDFERTELITKAIEFFKSFYIFGTAVARIDYHRDFYDLKLPPTYTVDIKVDDDGQIIDAEPRRLRETERVIRYDGPRLVNVSLCDFYPDPLFNEIERMRFVTEREETTRDKLREQDRRHFKATGKHLFKDLDEIPVFHQGMTSMLNEVEDFRQDTAEIMRFNFPQGGDVHPNVEPDDDMVILYHYWEDDRYVVMANGHTIIRDGENPYNDKRKPYVAAQCFPTLQEFYGQGLLAPIQYLQEELNTLRNIALDQGKLNMQGVWAVDDGVTLTDADMAVYPGKVWQTEFQGGQPLVAQVFQSELPHDWQALEARTQQDIQSALAINDYMIGAGGGSAGTASEAAMLNASAANRFRLQALIAQEKFVVKLSDMFLSRRQQFLDEPKVFRILGEQGYFYPEISPEDIWGRYDFQPQGSQSQPNKEVLRQQMIQLMTVAAGNPTTMTMTNWAEVYKELWQMFDFRFPERFILAPPERQLTQQQENYILLQGEKVAVEPNDPHEQHIQSLMEIIPEVVQGQVDERVKEAVQDHHDMHMRYMQAMQGQAGPAQAGAASPFPGNAPNQQQPPSMPQLQARAMGGPGGPVT